MKKSNLSQLNKLYVERCRQLIMQNQELSLKVAQLQNAINERNETIEALLIKTEGICDSKREAEPIGIIEQENTLEPAEKLEFEIENAEITCENKSAIMPVKEVVSTPKLPQLDDIGEYAANGISTIVISSAEYSNKISNGSYNDKKNLLNLIIGKTENTKYEITDTMQSDCSNEQKIKMIDSAVAECMEYFECVFEQK